VRNVIFGVNSIFNVGMNVDFPHHWIVGGLNSLTGIMAIFLKNVFGIDSSFIVA
jgi:hypothetical protein